MIISDQLILLDVEATNKNDLIHTLSERAFNEGKIVSINIFEESVLARETVVATGVGNGIAIPHGKSNTVAETMVIFAKLKDKVIWDEKEGEWVDLVFLLGVSESKANTMHLEILAKLSRNLMNESFVQSLRDAKSIAEVYQSLSVIESK